MSNKVYLKSIWLCISEYVACGALAGEKGAFSWGARVGQSIMSDGGETMNCQEHFQMWVIC